MFVKTCDNLIRFPYILASGRRFIQAQSKWVSRSYQSWKKKLQNIIVRLNSGNFEISYPSEFYSIMNSRVKSVFKIIQNDTNFGY